MKLRRLFFSLCIIFVFIASVIFLKPEESRAGSMVIKVSHQFAVGDTRDQMVKTFGSMVTKRTNGQIRFRYYPSASLFKPKEQWDALKSGALDMAVEPLDYASGKVPQLGITLMPATISSLAEGTSWGNKPIGKKIDAIMQKNGVKNLLWVWMTGGIGSKIRQIKVPSDVKGTKLRAAGRQFEYMMQKAGASIVSMPSSAAYQALASGVINTMMTSAGSFVTYRLYEQLKYINIPKYYSIWYMAENIVMSEKTWNKLTPSQKKVFNNVSAWMSKNWIPRHLKPLVDNMIKAYRKAGVQIYYMNKSDFNKWLTFAQKTAWKHFSNTVPGGKELLQSALDAMK